MERAKSKHRGTVAVLGAFDTWTYMYYIAEQVARNNFVAHTSRFVFAKDPKTQEIRREPFDIDPEMTMNEFLSNQLIDKSDRAIIVYSVPAAHYNEAEWCVRQGKPTLGIAFTRGITVTDMNDEEIPNCHKLLVGQQQFFSTCTATPPWTGWHCTQSAPCPFKKQGIAINQLEYFITNRPRMQLHAVERIGNADFLVQNFLAGIDRPGQ